MTAEFISNRTGEVSIAVSSQAKQLNTWRVSDYTPEYRETHSVGKRKLMTPDEVLRLPLDQELIILRGQKVLKAEKFDYTLHPESKKLKPCRASDHVPTWRMQPETPEPDFSDIVKPKPKARKAKAAPVVKDPSRKQSEPAPLTQPDEDCKIIMTDKQSILS